MAAALTDKQKRFCDEYLVDSNATQAAIRAGYSEATAQQIGSENLSKLVIQDYLQKRRAELGEIMGITQLRVIEEYKRIAFSDIRSYYDENGGLLPISELSDDAAAAIAGVEVDELKDQDGIKYGETKKLKRWDKLKALEGLGKHLGLFEKDNSQRKADPATTAEQFNQILSAAREGTKADSGE